MLYSFSLHARIHFFQIHIQTNVWNHKIYFQVTIKVYKNDSTIEVQFIEPIKIYLQLDINYINKGAFQTVLKKKTASFEKNTNVL